MPQRPVRSILGSQSPVTANGEMSVAQAARLMKERRVGAVLVMNEGRLAGIFTERDALFRVIAEGRDPAKTGLQDVMTANPRTITPDRPFGHAMMVPRIRPNQLAPWAWACAGCLPGAAGAQIFKIVFGRCRVASAVV